MEARASQKLKLLYIVNILKEQTDEEHPLNASEICEKLEGYGITAERKAIYSDIDALVDFGYDIINTRVPRRGYFLASRDFELPEIYLLSDAVRSADFVSPKKTRELIAKLDAMLSVHQAKKREKGIFINPKQKCNNEEIYYSIDKISEAIVKHKKVTLKYFQRSLTENRQIETLYKDMVVSPYALIWQNDHYYLVANNQKYDNLMHLRLDRMKGVEISTENWRHFSEVSPYTDSFDIADYTAKTFNMFGGKEEKIELRCNKKMLEQIIDRFSEEIFIYKVTDTTFSFSANAIISEGLIGWLLQFGTDIEVVSPRILRDSVAEKITALGELYNA